MTRTRTMALAPALIGLLAACSGLADGSDQPIASASASATPAAVASEAPASPEPGESASPPCADGRICTGLLGPGEWATGVVGNTTLTLTLNEEWHADIQRGSEYFSLFHLGDFPAILGAGLMDGTVFSNPCDDQVTEEIEPTAQALIDWLSAHPALIVEPAEEVTLGDATGLRVELSAFKPEPCPADGPIPPELILLWQITASDVFLFVDNTTAILYAVEIGDELVVVTAETIADPDPWVELVEPILDSITITAG